MGREQVSSVEIWELITRIARELDVSDEDDNSLSELADDEGDFDEDKDSFVRFVCLVETVTPYKVKNLTEFLRSNSACVRISEPLTNLDGHMSDAELLNEWKRRRDECRLRWGNLSFED